MTDLKRTSRLRQQLRIAANNYASAVKTLLSQRNPVTRGSFLIHGTRCGKPNCRCARGELHTATVLSVSEKGRQRTVYVRPPDRPEIQRHTEAYRRLRKARAELGKLNTEIKRIVDELVEALLEPYEPRKEEGSGRKTTKH